MLQRLAQDERVLCYVNREGRTTVADMDELEGTERLRHESARQRIALIETDIGTAITFLRLESDCTFSSAPLSPR